MPVSWSRSLLSFRVIRAKREPMTGGTAATCYFGLTSGMRVPTQCRPLAYYGCMRTTLLLLVLLSTFALASSKTYSYPEHGFSMRVGGTPSVEKSGEDSLTTYTYSEGPESVDGMVWQMDMITVNEGVDYKQVPDVRKWMTDMWAHMVSGKPFHPDGPLHYSKDAAGNEVVTFEAKLDSETDGKKIQTHFTMRFVAAVSTSRFYKLAVMRNFDAKVNDFDFIDSFKLLK